jgi:hypothetical protein
MPQKFGGFCGKNSLLDYNKKPCRTKRGNGVISDLEITAG